MNLVFLLSLDRKTGESTQGLLDSELLEKELGEKKNIQGNECAPVSICFSGKNLQNILVLNKGFSIISKLRFIIIIKE